MSIQTAPAAPARQPPLSAFDLRRIRDEFPILRQKVHGKPLVYLDNAATTQKPLAVLDALRRYYEAENANVHRGVHLLSERATEAYEAARVKVQKFVNANCLRELIFTKGCTEAINLVAQTYGRAHVKAGDEVVVTWLEHHSNIVPWQMLCQEKGARLRVVPITDAGELRIDELAHLLGPRTRLLALAHVSNSLGTINPVKEVIALAHSQGVPVLVDGAQAVPHLRVDVQDLDCDFYAFSGHKVYGPTGIGALYGKARHLETMPPYQGGGDMIRTVTFEKTTWNELPYKFEAGTPNIAGAIGLGAAVDYVEEVGRSAIAGHEQYLLEYATDRLSAVSGVRLVGTAPHKAAVLSFVVDNPPLSALDVGTQLDLEGIAVRTGHHCCQPVMDRFGIPGTARASLAVYNTVEEIDLFATALEKIVVRAGGRSRVPVRMVSAAGVKAEPVYPAATADSPQAAAEELVEAFGFFEEKEERYQYIVDLGNKLLPMPEEFKTEDNRVHGCQSVVHLHARQRPGTDDVFEFLADSDAAIVRGLIAILQRVFSGQSARAVLAFDTHTFFNKIGLDTGLILNRRLGLDAMVKRIRAAAAELIGSRPTS